MEKSKVDFAIITAIEVERKAVCQAFGISDEHRDRSKENYTYWRTQLDLGHRKFYELVVMQLPDVANVSAAVGASAVINDWHPQAVLMVGIAGAARESIQAGDLVLGQEIYYYERGKDTQTGILPEPKVIPASAALWNSVINIASWNASVSVNRPDSTNVKPTIHRGVIASGERVIANAETRDEITVNNRKILAIEMEGYGVSAAAWNRAQPVPCLVIRGISDAADAHKGDDWQPYAASAAAEFSKHFLLGEPLSPQNPPHPKPLADIDRIMSRYRLIVDDLKNGNLIPFLGPGINPEFYTQMALKLAECVQYEFLTGAGENNSQSHQLIQSLIGIPCSICHYWPQDRPSNCPMLQNMDGMDRENLQDCSLFIEQGLAVSKINLRYLAQYYILKNDLDSLYGNLYEILERLEQKYQPSAFHEFLAELPQRMFAYGYPKRSKGLPFQLIVTTNYDDMLERAFLKAQQPFDLVFYIADGPEKGKFKHKSHDGEVQTIGINDADYLPLRSPWGHSQYPRPIILKLFGTWEESWENNFVVTEQQMSYLISTLKQNLPTSLWSILTRGNILFMGYSPSDSDLQLMMNCLWPANRITGKSWLLHQAKPGDLEKKLWESRNVALLDMPSSVDEFVEQLQRAIEARIN
ncbi:nucleoside phosphorylase [Leptolyngbya sp. PCC 7375]|nr:nucleoside phosphorylase [Leptolyngbya sp. PCC 7375]